MAEFIPLAQQVNPRLARGGGALSLDPWTTLSQVPRGRRLRVGQRPAFGFWHLFDEPELANKKAGIPPAQLASFHHELKRRMPDPPVAVCHFWGENWTRYTQCEEIVLNDTDPVAG